MVGWCSVQLHNVIIVKRHQSVTLCCNSPVCMNVSHFKLHTSGVVTASIVFTQVCLDDVCGFCLDLSHMLGVVIVNRLLLLTALMCSCWMLHIHALSFLFTFVVRVSLAVGNLTES